MNKAGLFLLAGLCFFTGLWITLASLPNPYVYLPAVGMGVFIGAIGFYLVGYAIYGEEKREVSY